MNHMWDHCERSGEIQNRITPAEMVHIFKDRGKVKIQEKNPKYNN